MEVILRERESAKVKVTERRRERKRWGSPNAGGKTACGL